MEKDTKEILFMVGTIGMLSSVVLACFQMSQMTYFTIMLLEVSIVILLFGRWYSSDKTDVLVYFHLASIGVLLFVSVYQAFLVRSFSDKGIVNPFFLLALFVVLMVDNQREVLKKQNTSKATGN